MVDKLQTSKTSDCLSVLRIESVDILRGIIIILMVFVNDIASVSAAPSWMKHMPKEISGMTIADWVFPGFLFVMGMVIPAAMKKRLNSKQNRLTLILHILVRILSLVIIGVLLLNKTDDVLIGWRTGLWEFLMLISVFMIWHTLPQRFNKYRIASYLVKTLGGILLAVLAMVFKGKNGEWLKIEWWGILGMLGWAYFVAVIVYFLAREQRAMIAGFIMLLICAGIGQKQGFFDGWWPQVLPNASIWGSRAAIAVGGMLLGVCLQIETSAKKNIQWAVVCGIFFAAAGRLLVPLYGVHKLGASVSWCLLSMAITSVLWAGLYYIIDVKNYGWCFKFCAFTGQNALLIYLLAYLIYAGFAVFQVPYFALNDSTFSIGLARAVLYVCFVCGFAAFLGMKGFKLKL